MNTAIPVAITNVSRHFSDYVNRAAYGQERFALVRGGKTVAELGPAPARRTVADLLALLKALPALAPEDDASFRRDLAKIRAAAGKEEVSPWDA